MEMHASPEILEAGEACLPDKQSKEREEKSSRWKRGCMRGASAMKLYCLALISLLVALIYLSAETKTGVELADKILSTALTLLTGKLAAKQEETLHQLIANLTGDDNGLEKP